MFPEYFGRRVFLISAAAFTVVAFVLGVSETTGWVIAPLVAMATAGLCVAVTTEPRKLGQVLSAQWLVALGKYSYLLGPSYRGIDLATFPGGYSLGAVFYVMYLALPLIVAMASYRWFEEPILRQKDAEWTHRLACAGTRLP
jgi:peptidoglycan/LPS O-acetylase OafA/YrhL